MSSSTTRTAKRPYDPSLTGKQSSTPWEITQADLTTRLAIEEVVANSRLDPTRDGVMRKLRVPLALRSDSIGYDDTPAGTATYVARDVTVCAGQIAVFQGDGGSQTSAASVKSDLALSLDAIDVAFDSFKTLYDLAKPAGNAQSTLFDLLDTAGGDASAWTGTEKDDFDTAMTNIGNAVTALNALLDDTQNTTKESSATYGLSADQWIDMYVREAKLSEPMFGIGMVAGVQNALNAIQTNIGSITLASTTSDLTLFGDLKTALGTYVLGSGTNLSQFAIDPTYGQLSKFPVVDVDATSNVADTVTVSNCYVFHDGTNMSSTSRKVLFLNEQPSAINAESKGSSVVSSGTLFWLKSRCIVMQEENSIVGDLTSTSRLLINELNAVSQTIRGDVSLTMNTEYKLMSVDDADNASGAAEDVTLYYRQTFNTLHTVDNEYSVYVGCTFNRGIKVPGGMHAFLQDSVVVSGVKSDVYVNTFVVDSTKKDALITVDSSSTKAFFFASPGSMVTAPVTGTNAPAIATIHTGVHIKLGLNGNIDQHMGDVFLVNDKVVLADDGVAVLVTGRTDPLSSLIPSYGIYSGMPAFITNGQDDGVVFERDPANGSVTCTPDNWRGSGLVLPDFVVGIDRTGFNSSTNPDTWTVTALTGSDSRTTIIDENTYHTDADVAAANLFVQENKKSRMYGTNGGYPVPVSNDGVSILYYSPMMNESGIRTGTDPGNDLVVDFDRMTVSASTGVTISDSALNTPNKLVYGQALAGTYSQSITSTEAFDGVMHELASAIPDLVFPKKLQYTIGAHSTFKFSIRWVDTEDYSVSSGVATMELSGSAPVIAAIVFEGYFDHDVAVTFDDLSMQNSVANKHINVTQLESDLTTTVQTSVATALEGKLCGVLRKNTNVVYVRFFASPSYISTISTNDDFGSLHNLALSPVTAEFPRQVVAWDREPTKTTALSNITSLILSADGSVSSEAVQMAIGTVSSTVGDLSRYGQSVKANTFAGKTITDVDRVLDSNGTTKMLSYETSSYPTTNSGYAEETSPGWATDSDRVMRLQDEFTFAFPEAIDMSSGSAQPKITAWVLQGGMASSPSLDDIATDPKYSLKKSQGTRIRMRARADTSDVPTFWSMESETSLSTSASATLTADHLKDKISSSPSTPYGVGLSFVMEVSPAQVTGMQDIEILFRVSYTYDNDITMVPVTTYFRVPLTPPRVLKHGGLRLCRSMSNVQDDADNLGALTAAKSEMCMTIRKRPLSEGIDETDATVPSTIAYILQTVTKVSARSKLSLRITCPIPSVDPDMGKEWATWILRFLMQGTTPYLVPFELGSDQSAGPYPLEFLNWANEGRALGTWRLNKDTVGVYGAFVDFEIPKTMEAGVGMAIAFFRRETCPNITIGSCTVDVRPKVEFVADPDLASTDLMLDVNDQLITEGDSAQDTLLYWVGENRRGMETMVNSKSVLQWTRNPDALIPGPGGPGSQRNRAINLTQGSRAYGMQTVSPKVLNNVLLNMTLKMTSFPIKWDDDNAIGLSSGDSVTLAIYFDASSPWSAATVTSSAVSPLTTDLGTVEAPRPVWMITCTVEELTNGFPMTFRLANTFDLDNSPISNTMMVDIHDGLIGSDYEYMQTTGPPVELLTISYDKLQTAIAAGDEVTDGGVSMSIDENDQVLFRRDHWFEVEGMVLKISDKSLDLV